MNYFKTLFILAAVAFSAVEMVDSQNAVSSLVPGDEDLYTPEFPWKANKSE
jgi:hypothetical protein